jgi:hypothetical protein
MGNSEVEMKTFKAQVVLRLAAQGKRCEGGRTLRPCSCSSSNEYPADPHFSKWTFIPQLILKLRRERMYRRYYQLTGLLQVAD